MDARVKSSRTRDFSRPRLEFKYIVPIGMAEGFIDSLGDALVPDSNATEGSYRVCSLYYDTNDLTAYREKIDGEDPRYKLRVRFYGPAQSETMPAPDHFFVEAKHRHDQLVSKTRCKIAAQHMDPGASVLAPRLTQSAEQEDLAAAAQLDQLILVRQQQPFVVVSYSRKPFFARIDRNIRITVDTDLRAASPSGFFDMGINRGLSILPPHMAVVEIKFYWSMPAWLGAITVANGLQLRRFSKYASALEAVYPTITSRALRIARARWW